MCNVATCIMCVMCECEVDPVTLPNARAAPCPSRDVMNATLERQSQSRWNVTGHPDMSDAAASPSDLPGSKDNHSHHAPHTTQFTTRLHSHQLQASRQPTSEPRIHHVCTGYSTNKQSHQPTSEPRVYHRIPQLKALSPPRVYRVLYEQTVSVHTRRTYTGAARVERWTAMPSTLSRECCGVPKMSATPEW